MTYDEIREKLFSLSEEKFRKFSAKLTPNEDNIIGVRVPYVKALAKEIAKNDYVTFLKAPYTKYHEECLLYGLVIGYIKADIVDVLKYLDDFLPYIKNWAVCDSVVMNIKALAAPKNQAKAWDYLTNKLKGINEPFIKRAMIVAFFFFIKKSDCILNVSEIYATIKDDHYYVKMALAWGIAEIATENFTVALNLIKSNKLDRWVLNKAIQKSCESFRLTDMQKQTLKLYKQKGEI